MTPRFNSLSQKLRLSSNIARRSNRAVPALGLLAALGIIALTPSPVSAAGLNIYWDRLLQPGGGASDLFTDGGGSTTTGLMLQSGVNEAANAYHVSYPIPDDPSFTPYSDLASMAGGTVSYGYISGLVTTSVATTTFLGMGNGPNAFAHFNASWTDTLTIMPANPALIGQPGVLSGSVLVDTGGSVNVVGSSSPNDEAAGMVTGIFSVNGVNTFDFSLTVGDEFAPIGSVPPSTLVPITIGFIFGDPFEFGMGFSASSETSATSPNGYFGAETRADATLNFMNTIAWQGISLVTDSQGNPVEFDLSSESLTDWTQPATNPVPLPAAAWLFGSGLLGLIGVARRKAHGMTAN